LALVEELNKKLLDFDIGEAQTEEEMCITVQQILASKIICIGSQTFHSLFLVLLDEVRKTLPTASRQQLIAFAYEFENNRKRVIDSSSSTPSIDGVVNHLNSSGHAKALDVQPDKSKKEAKKAARKAFQKQKKGEERERLRKLSLLFRTNPNKVKALGSSPFFLLAI